MAHRAVRPCEGLVFLSVRVYHYLKSIQYRRRNGARNDPGSAAERSHSDGGVRAVRGRRRRRDDLAEPPRGHELRQLGAADAARRGARPRRGRRRRARRAHPRSREHVLRGRRPQHARRRVPRHDQQLGADRPGVGAHVRSRLQPREADRRGGRGLRRRRRLRADDLLRLRRRRRRRQDRRLPHPPRAVRRRRADLPPAALHRAAQDQGAAAHRQAAVGHASARTGGWRTCRRRPRSSTRRSPTSSRR